MVCILFLGCAAETTRGEEAGHEQVFDSQAFTRAQMISPAAEALLRRAMRPLLKVGPFHSRYTATDYGRLYYLDSQPNSHRPSVILLHGMGTSSLSLMPLAYLLRRHRRVIVPDLMNFAGLSEPSRPVALNTTEHVSTIAQLASALALGQVDVCGHSLGGGAAIHLAARHPDLVRSLSLINPGGFSFGFQQIRERFIPKENEARNGEAAGGKIGSSVRALPLGRWLSESYVGLGARVRSGVIGYLQSIQPYDFVDARVRSIACPTLVLWGENDQILPPDIPRFIAGELRHAEIQLLPRVGHLAVVEAPLAIVRHLCRFWAGAAPASS